MALTGGLVVGLGCRTGVHADDVNAVLLEVLASGDLDRGQIVAYATLETRGGEPGLRAAIGDALICFPARVLASIAVPNPSRAVVEAVGIPSVAEAAALCAAAQLGPAGSMVELIAPKRVGVGVTAAVASFRPGHKPRHGQGILRSERR